MSILKADILAFANSKLNRSETNIDIEIQTVLDDLADESLLIGSDITQSLADGTQSLNYPAGIKELRTIVLSDANQSYPPLEPMSWEDYKKAISYGGSNGRPESFAEYNGKYYLYPQSDGVFTAAIDYYKYHANSVSSIEFADEFRNCIYFGVTAEIAIGKNLTNYVNIWLPRYQAEKSKRKSIAPQKTYFVRD